MCLILLAFQVHPEIDLLLAGNRDEAKNRPAAPPALIARDPCIWAGRDLRDGGTWMGRNEAGIMVALTNRRTGKPAQGNPRSRGEVVMELLRRTTPEDAAQWLTTLPLDLFRPFNVVFGNQERFFSFGSEEASVPQELTPGYYVLSNSYLDDLSWPKVRRSHEFMRDNGQLPGEELLARLQLFLGDATPPDELPVGDVELETHGAFGAVFIRHEEYGTVSSSIYTAGPIGDRYYYAEGRALEKDPMHAFKLVAMTS